MVLGTDLVLNLQDNPEEIKHHGQRLGEVIIQAAERFRQPLAVPLMDLSLEKRDLLQNLGFGGKSPDTFHFTALPTEDMVARLKYMFHSLFSRRHLAHIYSIAHVASHSSLLPTGMVIGPFSLMTKLLADPINAVTAVLMDPDSLEAQMALRCLELAEITVQRSLLAQITAGARAVIVCEPTAGKTYISPRMMDLFEQFVIQPNLRLKSLLDGAGVDLLFHDCNELTTEMIRLLATRLNPVVMSLSSVRLLWEVAAFVPRDIVLFGNLPTKSFYSDSVMPIEEVVRLTHEIINAMHACGHPHILGTECDVLHVPGASVLEKVETMLAC